METARIADPITGDKLYQRRGRQALPLLVRQAEAATTILYSDLAAELGMPNPRNLNYVLGSIGQTLVELSTEWELKIPPIQCVVVNKETGLPGEGVGGFITSKEDFSALSLRQRRQLVNRELERVNTFTQWRRVLSHFDLYPAERDFTHYLEQAATLRVGESEAHERFKEQVARRPVILSLPEGALGKTDVALPSGDCVDVLFDDQKVWVAVAVKSRESADADLVRGLFQCIRNRAVIEAQQAVQGVAQSVRAVLVLEGSFPQHLQALKNTLGVEVVALGVTS